MPKYKQTRVEATISRQTADLEEAPARASHFGSQITLQADKKGNAPAVNKGNILQLQRTLGNQTVQRLLSRQVQRSTTDAHVCGNGCNHVARTLAASNVIQRDEADDKLGAYNTLQPDLAAYAARGDNRPKGDFDPKKLAVTSKAYALSLPRDADGQLTPEAIRLMNKFEQRTVQTMFLDKYSRGGIKMPAKKGFFFNKKLKKALKQDKNLNSLTGETKYPELANFLKPKAATDVPVTADMDVGGVSMNVTYNPSDVNYQARLGLLSTAVKRVTAQGFAVPPLKVQIPKFSRNLSISADCSIVENDTTSAAQYVAPNFMHLGSMGLNNPQEGTRINPDTGKEELKFTSAQVDTSGVGTVVHELGHAIHYALAPGKFHELSSTSFANGGGDLANKVSGYATNPREFIAEVFTGTIHGKTYPDEIIRMYKAFGGPMTSELERQTIVTRKRSNAVVGKP
ncbi:MAG: uncharacterized protein JWP00_4259 [Chloroflexi bacterium]|jgi:hypothetical protein|nr:uncharacterized protein [Chloroflexota bacterium]